MVKTVDIVIPASSIGYNVQGVPKFVVFRKEVP